MFVPDLQAGFTINADGTMKKGSSFDEVSFRHSKRLEERLAEMPAVGAYVHVSNIIQQQADHVFSNAFYENQQSENHQFGYFPMPFAIGQASQLHSSEVENYNAAIIPPPLSPFYGNWNSDGSIAIVLDQPQESFVWPDSLRELFEQKSLQEWKELKKTRKASRVFISMVYERWPELKESIDHTTSRKRIMQWFQNKTNPLRYALNASSVSRSSEVPFAAAVTVSDMPLQDQFLPVISSPPRTSISAIESSPKSSGFRFKIKLKKPPTSFRDDANANVDRELEFKAKAAENNLRVVPNPLEELLLGGDGEASHDDHACVPS